MKCAIFCVQEVFLCVGATYHSSKNARDRDRLRQEILERMGWKFYRIWSTDWFRNKEIEQIRLLDVASSVVKNPKEEYADAKKYRTVETFEEVASEDGFSFPQYKSADIEKICEQHNYNDFKAIVKDILEVENPISEELLLKRTVWYFDREKVTSVVQQEYEKEMKGCKKYGITRRN
ncbi:MAG: hypothetical protein Q4A15_13370, partial [Prevotellaceae bacterium]|nr:hypothetical protein [Prevotellaceae bacterium]